MELLRQFGIEWKLLVAQIINFLVLLFVLWKFAYKPILALLQKRTELVERGLRDAEEAKQELARIKEIEQDRMLALEHRAEEIVNQARQDAKKRTDEILMKAQGESERVLAESKRAIALERAKMIEGVRGELADIVLAATGSILRAEKLEKEHTRRAEEAVSTFLRDKG